MIVTTRPDTEICTQVDITNLRVNKLEEKDIISIISKLDSNNNSPELPAAIKSNKNLRETLISPILVNLFVVCYPLLDVVPENVKDFYEKLFITLYSRHDKIKGFARDKYSSLPSVKANEIFNSLCFYSLSKGVLDFSENSLHEYISKSLKHYSIDDSFATPLQNDFINITCLIQRDGFDRYVYLHKSIQEFHAAKFISTLSFKQKITFYNKICDKIEQNDTFDNVINFLKEIDKNDYNALLIMKYFEKYNLTHKESNIDKIIDDITSNILESTTCYVSIDENRIKCSQVNSFVHENILSVLSLFKNGFRFEEFEVFEEKIVIILFTTNAYTDDINEKIINKSLKKLTNNDKKDNIDDIEYMLKVSDYLQLTEHYEKIRSLISEKIKFYFNETYVSTHEYITQSTQTFDLDFEL